MKIPHKWCLLFLLTAGCLSITPLYAGETLTVGVASNFMLTFEDLARHFEEMTTVRVKGVFTSTGNLYAQIRNGAPYDIFLAADDVRPAKLFEEGLAEKAFTYARGRVALWTAKEELCRVKDWRRLISMADVKRIAIANPETAPYGSASVAALKKAALLDIARPKLIYGQNITQTFQYVYSRSADMGFCALSSVYALKGHRG